MSAPQGDSPDVFVFPPFAPPVRQESPAAPEPVQAPDPETSAEAEPFELEVPLPAHDLGDPEGDAAVEVGSWAFADDSETADTAPGADDLPWLEMPEGVQNAHGSDAELEETTAADVPSTPGWMTWDTEESSVGSTAAEITPPPLAAAGELTSVSAVPSPAAEPFAAPDPYAPTAEAAHPETLSQDEPPPVPHSWPVEAMEPAALQSAEAATVVETPVAPDAVAVHAPAVDHAAFGRVADRLEAAAQALRSDPGGFVAAHHDDPLALLVVGYALGYRQARPADE